MKKTILAVALVVFFVMALAVPAFAQSMDHTKTAEIDGMIDWELQAGHLCNTGLEFKSTIQGPGEFSKTMSTTQVRGKTTVSDVNDFVAGASNLSIISTIELCAPPKYEVTATDYVYYDDTLNAAGNPYGWYTVSDSFIPTVNQGYENQWGKYDPGLLELAQAAHPELGAQLATLTQAQLEAVIGGAHPGPWLDGELSTYEWDPVSSQIWAVHVNADPGYSGNLHQDFEAANGPYGGEIEDAADVPTSGPGTHAFYLKGNTPYVGENYVGNYFNIEQMARTSMGTVQRFIDISSPWSHAYVYEDMTVVGKSEIEEAFSMTNVGPGADVPGLWYDLF